MIEYSKSKIIKMQGKIRDQRIGKIELLFLRPLFASFSR